MTARLLMIFAHPDDESFSAAGVARRYADAGAEVALVTATRGDAGRAGEPALCKEEELPARREAELREAAAILGIRDVHLLDYCDKQLADAPPNQIRQELVGVIRRQRPHVLITFDPNGANGHADHIAIGRFAMDAAAAAADERWYKNAGPAHRVRRVLWTSPLMPWAVPSKNVRDEPGIDFLVDISAYRKTKADALRAHRTQHLSIDRSFFNLTDASRVLSVETFRQAWGPRLTHVPEDDLFAGIEMD